MESLRNRFFGGGDFGEKKITWVKWKKCLASKKDGGLGIGSLFALNRALLFKWIWRFWYDQNALWVKVVKSIYGASGCIGKRFTNNVSNSTWISILKAVQKLDSDGIPLLSLCKKKVGDGKSTLF